MDDGDMENSTSSDKVLLNTLSETSKEKYKAIYSKFMDWRKTKNTNSLSQELLLTFFSELGQTMKPSTLWATYSMLKNTLSTYDNVDISNYRELSAYLKKKSAGFISKKAKVLTSKEVEQFLNEAPDCQFLVIKVALIFGINGACRRDELCNIRVNDITDHHPSLALIKIPQSKKRTPRSFVVTGEFYDIFKKYADLRPTNPKTDRFFLNYQNSRCTRQPIGINKFGNMPKQIAEFLKLPNPEQYTGHSFRRTSATLLGDAGAEFIPAKRRTRFDCKTKETSNESSETSSKRQRTDSPETPSLNDPSPEETYSPLPQVKEESDELEFEFIDIKFENLDPLSSVQHMDQEIQVNLEYPTKKKNLIFECDHYASEFRSDVKLQVSIPLACTADKSCGINTFNRNTFIDSGGENDDKECITGFHGFRSIKDEQGLLNLVGVSFKTFYELVNVIKNDPSIISGFYGLQRNTILKFYDRHSSSLDNYVA